MMTPNAQDAPGRAPKPLLGKHVFELRVASDRLDLRKARGTLRLEPAEGPPIVHALHYENPSVPEPAPADVSTRELRLGDDGPEATLTMFRPPTDFAGMTGVGNAAPGSRRGRGYFFVDLLFDRPDPRFKGVVTLEVDGRKHAAAFDYPWAADGRREAK